MVPEGQSSMKPQLRQLLRMDCRESKLTYNIKESNLKSASALAMGPQHGVGLKLAAICMGAQANTHRAALIHQALLFCCSWSGSDFIPCMRNVGVCRGPTLEMEDCYMRASQLHISFHCHDSEISERWLFQGNPM